MPAVAKCPRCGRSLRLHDHQYGKVVTCPHCKGRFEAARPPEPSPPRALPAPPAKEIPHVEVIFNVKAAPDDGANDEPQYDPVVEAVRRPRATHCFGCGRALRNAIACPECGETFCSEVCIRRHDKYTMHFTESAFRNMGCGLLALSVLALAGWAWAG